VPDETLTPDELGIDPKDFASVFARALEAAPSEASRRWMVDVARRAQARADRELVWLQQLRACCSALTAETDGPPWSVVEIFWPRLLGALTELRTKYHDSIESARSAGTIGTIPVIALRVSLKALDEMRDAVMANESHVVAIDYFRQRACHVSQTKFALQWDRSNERLRPEERLNPINGKKYTVREMDEILQPIFRGLPGDEAFIAADIAEVVKPHVEYIVFGLQMLRDPVGLREVVKIHREARAEANGKGSE
jgi:hypothetical protein